jgi:hypothetical protein
MRRPGFPEEKMFDRDAEKYFTGLRERVAKALRKPKQIKRVMAWPDDDPPLKDGVPDEDAMVGECVESIVDFTTHVVQWFHLPRTVLMVTALREGAVDETSRVVKRLRALRYTIPEDRVSTQFLKALDDEIDLLKVWKEKITSWGTAGLRKNFDYDAAGCFVTDYLADCGLPYAAVEAVLIFWHAGYSQFERKEDEIKEVSVINPFKPYTQQPGKDFRDPARAEAQGRWKRHKTLIEKHPSLKLHLEEGFLGRGPTQDWEPTEAGEYRPFHFKVVEGYVAPLT